MKSTDMKLLEVASLESSTTWGWSTDGEHSVMFRFDELSASAVWGGSGIPLDCSKEIEKPLN
jgi:hypothetical protein